METRQGNAIQLGSCNNCNEGRRGTQDDSDRSKIIITEFDLGSLVFRLCDKCKAELIGKCSSDGSIGINPSQAIHDDNQIIQSIKPDPKTVKEMQIVLSRMPSDAKILGTWQGMFWGVGVYQSKNGSLIIDLDENLYREQIESGELTPEE